MTSADRAPGPGRRPQWAAPDIGRATLATSEASGSLAVLPQGTRPATDIPSADDAPRIAAPDEAGAERESLLAETQAARRTAEQRATVLDATVAGISDGVVVTDALGRVVRANAAACLIYGYTQEDWDKQTEERIKARTYFREDGSPLIPADSPLRRALRGEWVREQVLCFYREPDVATWISVNGGPIRAPGGTLIGAMAIVRDITEARRLRLEREALLAEVDQARASVNRLESLAVQAGGIAHDFNNLLTGIMGHIVLAKHASQGNLVLEGLLGEGERAAARARGLARQLLALSRGCEPARKPVCVPVLAMDAATFALRGSTVRLRSRFPPALPLVEGDEGQLAQVVQNLALNASEAMPGGGTVTIAAQPVDVDGNDGLPLSAGAYVCLSVSDDGPGIEPAIQDKVFDPYFSTKPAGSGLGLSVVHSVMARHGGCVTLTSAPGQGSRFDLYLPAARQGPALGASD